MLVKIFGSFIVMAASTMLGYALARDCSKRPNDLRTLQALLQMFENEITYLSNLLSVAFGNICRSNKSTVAEFFSSTINILKKDSSKNASEAWEIAIGESISKTSLNKEDKEILVSFGKMLGNSDIEGQIKNIKLTLNQLKLQEQKAEESKKKNETMYRTLGVLGGIAIVVILI
jgi:stage III sporulation protein AB